MRACRILWISVSGMGGMVRFGREFYLPVCLGVR
jgi:hypothetical protein